MKTILEEFHQGIQKNIKRDIFKSNQFFIVKLNKIKSSFK